MGNVRKEGHRGWVETLANHCERSYVTFPVERKLTFNKTFTFKACNVWNRCFNLPEIICIINPTCGLSNLPKSRWQYGIKRITNLTHHWDWFDLAWSHHTQRSVQEGTKGHEMPYAAILLSPTSDLSAFLSNSKLRGRQWVFIWGVHLTQSVHDFLKVIGHLSSHPMCVNVVFLASWVSPLTPGTRRCYSWEHIGLSVYFQA